VGQLETDVTSAEDKEKAAADQLKDKAVAAHDKASSQRKETAASGGPMSPRARAETDAIAS
jgi:hypothetical protein